MNDDNDSLNSSMASRCLHADVVPCNRLHDSVDRNYYYNHNLVDGYYYLDYTVVAGIVMPALVALVVVVGIVSVGIVPVGIGLDVLVLALALHALLHV